jgi:PAS domain-containing protein
MDEMVAKIKRGILASSNASYHLRCISSAGMDRDVLLDLLARAVVDDLDASSSKSQTERMRAKQRELRSIAGQMETMARHAERVALDPESYLEFWSPMSSKDFEDYKSRQSRLRASRWPFQSMREYANWARDMAQTFGKCLTRNARRERYLGIFFLLIQVHHRTGKRFEAHLAHLLTDAFQFAGVKRVFTKDQLRKMFVRHVFPVRPRRDKSAP